MKITFLLYNAYGIGGTIRATANLATALAERHEVEVVSYYRTADTPSLPFGPGVTLRPLVDLRPGSRHYDGRDPAQRASGTVCPHDLMYKGKTPPSRLGETRLAEHLRRSDADVVIATRPYLVCFLAEHGRADQLRIGQEHVTHDFHRAGLRRDQDAAIARLDAFVTVSHGDERAYRAALPDVPTRLTHIPNCIPAPEAEASSGDTRTVVAAGRLVPVKRYDRLIGAFAKVAAQHPDWTLRIYGQGREKEKLRRRVHELGLHDHVFLMDARTSIDTEWAKGAVAAVSSSTESFGMTIVEAMRLGVPVVSTDCDFGPREIITHGEDGLLVPADGPDAAVEEGIADALCRLIENDAERFRMAQAAIRSARRFLPDHTAAQYEALIDDLRPGAAASRRSRTRTARTAAARTPRQRVGALAERLGVAAWLGKALPPVAVGCRVAPDGSLYFRVPVAELTHGDWQLVLRPRAGTEDDTVRLPFRVTADDTEPYAKLLLHRSGRPMAEGYWNVHLQQGRKGRVRRARAGLVETGRLLAPTVPPHPSGAGFATAVPYRTQDGNLSLRTWSRAAHAELESLAVDPDAITLTGTVHGAAARGHHYRLRARLRGGDASFETRCTVDEAGCFTARVPLTDPAGQHPGGEAIWDLGLEPYDEQGHVIRLARLRGDVIERRRTDVFPSARPATADGALELRPYLTSHNDLALKAVPDPVAPARESVV
ncbi:glycosyltransferase family 4 protein [Streptomyces sp. MNP-20]|uniref:glycosyltransferase family 4 protein n=1 Tax=Streptomyces sp. MNP-20 TaxID=2721165 RepID=UPI00155350BF|nr:glycosyltransferase family 4 protein [Streptomyces sp. MNP-20]